MKDDETWLEQEQALLVQGDEAGGNREIVQNEATAAEKRARTLRRDMLKNRIAEQDLAEARARASTSR